MSEGSSKQFGAVPVAVVRRDDLDALSRILIETGEDISETDDFKEIRNAYDSLAQQVEELIHGAAAVGGFVPSCDFEMKYGGR